MDLDKYIDAMVPRIMDRDGDLTVTTNDKGEE